MTKQNNKKRGGNKRPRNVQRSSKPEVGLISRPTIRTMTDRRPVIVSRSELIYEGSSAITTPALLMYFQPGNFDWLGPIASRYEYYEVLKATVRFESWSGSTTGGLVALGIDYDVHDSPPGDLSDMANGLHTVSSVNWKSFSMQVQTGNIVPKRLYTTNGGYPEGVDRKFYDAFTLYAYGSNAFSGTVWIDYTVKFTSPQMSFGMVGSIDSPPSPEVHTAASGNQYIKEPVVTSKSAPVSIRLPTADEVSAGLVAGVKSVVLPAMAERLFNVTMKTDAATTGAVLHSNQLGVTVSPVTDVCMASDGKTFTRSYAVKAGRGGGTMQFGLNPATTVNLSDMFIDAISAAAKQVLP